LVPGGKVHAQTPVDRARQTAGIGGQATGEHGQAEVGLARPSGFSHPGVEVGGDGGPVGSRRGVGGGRRGRGGGGQGRVAPALDAQIEADPGQGEIEAGLLEIVDTAADPVPDGEGGVDGQDTDERDDHPAEPGGGEPVVVASGLGQIAAVVAQTAQGQGGVDAQRSQQRDLEQRIDEARVAAGVPVPFGVEGQGETHQEVGELQRDGDEVQPEPVRQAASHQGVGVSEQERRQGEGQGERREGQPAPGVIGARETDRIGCDDAGQDDEDGGEPAVRRPVRVLSAYGDGERQKLDAGQTQKRDAPADIQFNPVHEARLVCVDR